MANETCINGAFHRIGLIADQTWWTNDDYDDDYKLASLQLWNEIISPSRKIRADYENLSNRRNSNHQTDQGLRKSQADDTSSGSSKHKRNAKNEYSPANFKLDDGILPYSVDNMDQVMLFEKISNNSVRRIWVAEKGQMGQVETESGQRSKSATKTAQGRNFRPLASASSSRSRKNSNIFSENVLNSNTFQTERKTILKKTTKGSDWNIVKNFKGSMEQKNTWQSQDGNSWLHAVYPHRVPELVKLASIIQHLECIAQQISFSMTQAGQNAVQRPPEQNHFDELERQALEQYQPSDTSLTVQSVEDSYSNDPVDSEFLDLEREALEQYGTTSDTQIDRISSNFANDSEPGLRDKAN